MDQRRRFNRREKSDLFHNSDGLCQCGAPLEESWHADHKNPYSNGGPTELANGQPLCPPCNLKKGSRVDYEDAIVPRAFQRELIRAVQDGMAAGRRETVVLASPGSGKTLAYQAVATQLIRQGQIDFVLIFTPRKTLCEQTERKWMIGSPPSGQHLLFDDRLRLGKIQWIVSTRAPLVPSGWANVGLVSTYAALTDKYGDEFVKWAQEHRGRFLLVADEAQCCGDKDDVSAGTKAGQKIVELHDYAAHTLLLTGTPYRSDGKKLVLCGDYYTDSDDGGLQRLTCHARAEYVDGVRDNYLRRYEAPLRDARVLRETVEKSRKVTREYSLSKDGDRLGEVIRQERVWQSLVDDTVVALCRKQQRHHRYGALIACMEQREARKVAQYLRERHPEMRVVVALSEDGDDARENLQNFKEGPYDILVTVRMAFMGYDCERITVVGVLTHYRDPGHLSQLVGRGMRVWDPKKSGIDGRLQSVNIIAPDDPLMHEFLAGLEDASRLGVREAERAEARVPSDSDSLFDLPPAIDEIRDAWTTGTRVQGYGDADGIDEDEYEYLAAIRDACGSSDDISVIKRMAALMARVEASPAPKPRAPMEEEVLSTTEMVDRELIEHFNRETASLVGVRLRNAGISHTDSRERYEKARGRCTAWINKQPGCCPAGLVRTPEQAKERFAAAERLDVWRVMS